MKAWRRIAFLRFLVNQAGEASTWQGVGFLVTLAGSHWAAHLDWGAAAALGGAFSAFVKTVFPDKLKHPDLPQP